MLKFIFIIIYKHTNNKSGLATAINNIGFIYKNQGNIQRALEIYDEALKIQEEILEKEAPARGGGFLAMTILHGFEIKDDKKGILSKN